MAVVYKGTSISLVTIIKFVIKGTKDPQTISMDCLEKKPEFLMEKYTKYANPNIIQA